MSVIFLERQKRKQFFILYLCLIQLKSCNCIKIEKQPPEVFCKKGVSKNFTKFTGKQLCESLFLNKIAGLSTATLLKRRLWYRCFPVNFGKYLRNTFFTEHLRCLVPGEHLRCLFHFKFAFYFMFTFSFKFSQTSLIIKELIKHENKFNRKVFHHRENSENRWNTHFMK